MKSGLRLGVDLGGTQVKLALVDAGGNPVSVKQVDTVLKPKILVSNLKRAVKPWFTQGLLGTGVGVAGDVDSEKGVVRFSPNLDWHYVPLKSLFTAAGFPQPIYVENDANAAAWGAYHVELKRKSRNLAVLTLGTGVGGGLVLNGLLHRGATGSAGEIGHMTIDPQGPACGCGSYGCLEAYLGRSFLTHWARGEMAHAGRPVADIITPLELSQMARRGDPIARRAWQRAGRALGIGLSNVINVFNPDTILLCGGVAGSADLLLAHARKEIAYRAFKTPRQAVRIRVSTQNKHLGVIGSALLVP